MNAFLVNSREKIKVNRDGGDRQWPQWFLGVEKWDSMMRVGWARVRVCKNLQTIRGESLDAALEGQVPPYFSHSRSIFLAELLISGKRAVNITTRSRHQL